NLNLQPNLLMVQLYRRGPRYGSDRRAPRNGSDRRAPRYGSERRGPRATDGGILQPVRWRSSVRRGPPLLSLD
uniref:Uncharacterized protein n=1 Tax=Denticeps clupeoides TaxID=299321 RepID=A0AAY4CIL9_9TELE